MWGLFPALFSTCDFPTPTLELNVRESRVHGLKLVAYSNLPIEFGGSGTLMDEALSSLGMEKGEGGDSEPQVKQENS